MTEAPVTTAAPERAVPGVWGLAPGHDSEFVAQSVARAWDTLANVVAPGAVSRGADGAAHRVPEAAWGTAYAPYAVSPDGEVRVPVEGVLLGRLPIVVPGVATGYDYLEEVVAKAMDDPRVSVLRFEISSPGGEASRAHAMARAISAAREKGLRVEAHARDLAASAAYISFVTADRFSAEPAAVVGSLGVLSEMTSVHRALDRQGIDVAVVAAGALKEANSPATPLLPEAVQSQQVLVDGMYDQFVALVAEARGVEEGVIREEWGARTFLAPEAERLGMIDGVVFSSPRVSGLQSFDTGAKARGKQAISEDEKMAKTDTATKQAKQAEQTETVNVAELEAAARAAGAQQVLGMLASLRETAGEDLPPAFAAGLDVILAGGGEAAVAAAVAAVTKAVEQVKAQAPAASPQNGATALERLMAHADTTVEAVEGPDDDEPVSLVAQVKALRGV